MKSFARISSPLIYCTLERAQTVSLLLAARGFGIYQKRTSLYVFPFKWYDYVLMVFYIALLGITLVLGFGFRVLEMTF
jgi:energy-coupling factor transporter transmembrane protein EcfT